jgi:hypothetical protein
MLQDGELESFMLKREREGEEKRREEIDQVGNISRVNTDLF